MLLLPYSKSKLELESNLSQILPVNCNFIRCSTLSYLEKSNSSTWSRALSTKKIQDQTKFFCITRVWLFRV